MTEHALPESWTNLPRELRDVVLKKLIDRRRQLGASTTRRLLKANRTKPVPATLEQEFFLQQQRKFGGRLAWTIAGPPIILEQIDVEKAKNVFKELVRRHEMLRTTFRLADGQSELLINAAAPIPLKITKLPLTAVVLGTEAWIKKRYETLLKETFDSENGPLWRAELVIRGNRGVILTTFCSLIVDGESLYLIARDIHALLADPDNQDHALPTFDYADYAHTQAQLVASGYFEGALDWWRQRLAGGPPKVWSDHRQPVGEAYLYEQTLGTETGRALDAFAAKQQTTSSVIILTEFMRLLHNLDGNHDLWLASSAATRDLAGSETIVGTFARQVLLRFTWPTSGDPTAAVHAMLGETLDQPPVPHLLIKNMLEKSHPEAPSAFRYIFNYRLVGEDASQSPQSEDVSFRPNPNGSQGEREEDIMFMVMQSGQQRVLHWYLRQDRFDAPMAKQLLENFHATLLQQLRQV